MNFTQMVFLGIGLSMDACAVAMSNGLNDKNIKKRKGLLIAVFFGLFQGIMPLVGYFAGSIFMEFISNFAPYIALILLGFIGGKMIIEGTKHKNEDNEEKKLTIKNLLIQAIATSIDALTIGLVFVNTTTSNPTLTAITAASIIAITTCFLSYIAVFIGKKFGTILSGKAEVAGGVILVAIGLKTFIDYLMTR